MKSIRLGKVVHFHCARCTEVRIAQIPSVFHQTFYPCLRDQRISVVGEGNTELDLPGSGDYREHEKAQDYYEQMDCARFPDARQQHVGQSYRFTLSAIGRKERVVSSS